MMNNENENIIKSDEKMVAIVKVTELQNDADVTALVKRVFMFLEDGEFERADDFCEQILDKVPENAQAHLGKLLSKLRVKKLNKIVECENFSEEDTCYQRALKFADEQLRLELMEYAQAIKTRREEEQRERERKINLAKEKKEKRKKNAKKIVKIATLVLGITAATVSALVVLATKVIIPEVRYHSAYTMFEDGDYDGAYSAFDILGTYRNSSEMALESKYQKALLCIENKDYEETYSLLTELEYYKNCEGLRITTNLLSMVNANAGDTVRIEQIGTPIVGKHWNWQVLEKRGDKILLLGPVYDNGENIYGGWEKSPLRQSLNNVFLLDFPEEIRDRIVETTVVNPLKATETTKDKVFILSKEEVEKYKKAGIKIYSSTRQHCLRDVDGNEYNFLTSKNTFSSVEYIIVPEYKDLDSTSLELFQHTKLVIKASKNNSQILEAVFRPAMWVDISDIER